MNTKEWLLLLLLSFIWGGSYFFTSIALKEVLPFTLVAFRVSFGALFLFIIFWFSKLRFPSDLKVLGMFFVMGLFNNAIPFSLIVWGQISVSSSLASIIVASAPIFTIFVAHFFTQDEKLNPIRLFGTFLGLGGVIVVIGWQNINLEKILPQLIIVLACVFYSFASVFGKQFHKKGIPPMVVAMGQLFASSLILLMVALFIEGPIKPLSPHIWLAILGFSLLCTTIAYIIFFYLLKTIGSNNLILVTIIAPISAIFLGVVFLGDEIKIRYIVGLFIIVLALSVIDGRVFLLKKKEQKNA